MNENILSRLRSLKLLWREWFVNSRVLPLKFAPDLPEDDLKLLRKHLHECLEAKGGEVSARNRAASLGQAYLGLNKNGRERFLRLLAEEFTINSQSINQAIAVWQENPAQGLKELRRAVISPALGILTQFNVLPQGVKFLADMRADIIGFANPALKELDAALHQLLTSWFDVGFLELRRITWQESAAILEKLIAYEAVHAIQGWDDLKNRLDSDRRLYAFFHPHMPGEPLIFVEVALLNQMASNVQDLLDMEAPLDDPNSANTAIFYSISNCQKGLAGISFGNFLIKQVVGLLKGEFKNLKTFATLSPIPGFSRWLEEQIKTGDRELLLPEEHKLIASLTGGGAKAGLKEIIQNPAMLLDPQTGEALARPLTRLCVRYLAKERKPDGKALDPVAHFHLSNGARIERVNWLADNSSKGLKQSAGLMVNYLYQLADLEENHELYASKGEAALSGGMDGLL